MALTELAIKSLPLGRHGDGDGLYLDVRPDGRSWVYRYQMHGKRRAMGLGTYPTVTSKRARELRNEAKALIARGEDPIEARASLVAAKTRARTFDEVATEYIAAHEPSWKNAKHVAQWRSTIKTYVSPYIGTKRVEDVSTEDLLRILKSIWYEKTETASRVRGRVESILSYATVNGLRSGVNPALWKGHLDALLPSPTQVTKPEHHPAQPYKDAPQFFTRLRLIHGVSPVALRWVMLCGCRSGEARLAKWGEIDTTNWIWTIPGERMKAKRPHTVPITYAMRRVLVEARRLRLNDWIFPSSRQSKPLSDMSLSMLMRDHAPGYTVHGFRSTMTDWFLECTDVPTEIVELQLAHNVGTKVEQAYRRGKALAKRFDAMALWAKHLRGSEQL